MDEPATDLGVGLAIISSFVNRAIDVKTVTIGELGLGGEVRPVPQIERRVMEAVSLGFQRCLAAGSNLNGWPQPAEMELVGVDGLETARNVAFGE